MEIRSKTNVLNFKQGSTPENNVGLNSNYFEITIVKNNFCNL